MARFGDSKRPKLSKNLLEMKFMKKSKEKAEKEEEEEERKLLFEHEVTESMRKGGSKYVFQDSYITCENLIFGRVSYKGFNPEIERLMAVNNSETNSEDEVAVSDREMTERYSTFVGTVAKKFNKKRKHNIKEEIFEEEDDDNDKPKEIKKKSKFLKPTD